MGPTMCVLLGADDSITKIQMYCIAKLQLKLQKMDHLGVCAAQVDWQCCQTADETI